MAAAEASDPGEEMGMEGSAAPDGIPMVGPPSLLAAAMHGFADLVKELLADGADLNIRQQPSQNSCLHLAAMSGQADVLKVLLEAGLPVDCRNAGGDTALMFAASRGFAGVAVRLIKAGADLTCSNRSGLTPLMVAASAGQSLAVQALLRSAAQQDDSSNDKSTVQHMLTQVNEHGNTALHFAARTGFSAVVEVLLNAGAACTIQTRNLDGRTPLVEARLSGNKACYELIESRAQPVDTSLLSELVLTSTSAAPKSSSQRSNGSRSSISSTAPVTSQDTHSSNPASTGSDNTQPSSSVTAMDKQPSEQLAEPPGSLDLSRSPGDTADTVPVSAAHVTTPTAAALEREREEGLQSTDSSASPAWTSVNKRSGRITTHHPPDSTPQAKHPSALQQNAAARGAQQQQHHSRQTHAPSKKHNAASVGPPGGQQGAQSVSGHTGDAGHSSRLPATGSVWAKPPPPGMAPRAHAGPPPGIIASSLQPQTAPRAAVVGPPPGIPLPVGSPAAGRPRSPVSASGAADWATRANALMQEEFPEAAALDILPQHVLGLGLEELSYSQLEALELVHHAALKRLGEARLSLVREQERARMLEAARLQTEVAQLRAQLQSSPV